MHTYCKLKGNEGSGPGQFLDTVPPIPQKKTTEHYSRYVVSSWNSNTVLSEYKSMRCCLH